MYNIIYNHLVKKNIVVDNEYLEKYVTLITENRYNSHIPFTTQTHHIIPKFVYKDLGIECDDSDENKVVLTYADHVRAHFYLAMCSSTKVYRDKNLCAVRKVMRGLTPEVANDIENNLDEIQRIYEESKHITCIKEETKSKISASLVGRKCIRNINTNRFSYVYEDELPMFLANGWVLDHNKQNDESKNKISKANSGRKHVHKDGKVKSVKIEELSIYLQNGWQIGDVNRSNRGTLNGKVAIHKDTIVKYVNRDSLHSYLSDGWKLGTNNHKGGKPKGYKWEITDAMRKRAEDRKNYKAIHLFEKIKYVRLNELDSYLSSGWKLGTGRHPTGVSGKIWINNGEKEKYIFPEDYLTYEKQGWIKGRKKRGE